MATEASLLPTEARCTRHCLICVSVAKSARDSWLVLWLVALSLTIVAREGVREAWAEQLFSLPKESNALPSSFTNTPIGSIHRAFWTPLEVYSSPYPIYCNKQPSALPTHTQAFLPHFLFRALRFEPSKTSRNKLPAFLGGKLVSKPTQEKPPRIIIAGAPCTGKGTQCHLLNEKFGIIHISTGDLLRDAAKEDTETGKQITSYLELGKLVPDDAIQSLVIERLNREDCRHKGWLLDGFPRTESQISALANASIQPTLVLLLEAPEDLLIRRSINRRLDPVTGKIYNLITTLPPTEEISKRLIQRRDDTEEVIRNRIAQYASLSKVIRHHYKQKVMTLDGSVHASITFKEILDILQPNRNKSNIKPLFHLLTMCLMPLIWIVGRKYIFDSSLFHQLFRSGFYWRVSDSGLHKIGKENLKDFPLVLFMLKAYAKIYGHLQHINVKMLEFIKIKLLYRIMTPSALPSST